MTRLRPLLIGSLLLVILLIAEVGLACPTCKEGMEHDPAAMSMARGYFWSILFMMSMPFLILASLGSYFYLEICKARRKLATQPLNESLSESLS